MVLRDYCWCFAQESLLLVLRAPNIVPRMESDLILQSKLLDLCCISQDPYIGFIIRYIYLYIIYLFLLVWNNFVYPLCEKQNIQLQMSYFIRQGKCKWSPLFISTASFFGSKNLRKKHVSWIVSLKTLTNIKHRTSLMLSTSNI